MHIGHLYISLARSKCYWLYPDTHVLCTTTRYYNPTSRNILNSKYLKVFEIVWMVGFVWCRAFQYRSTGIRSLFLYDGARIQYATHIAVVSPMKSIEDTTIAPPSLIGQTIAAVCVPIDFVLRTIFSYPYNISGWNATICPIWRLRR
jgi:hypothetical protein